MVVSSARMFVLACLVAPALALHAHPRWGVLPRSGRISPCICSADVDASSGVDVSVVAENLAEWLSAPMPIDKADEVLSAYDNAHRAVASQPDAEGLGGALTANAWSLNADAAPLAAAVRSLAATALQRDGRLMLGICANDAAEGVATLKKWVGALQLPRGELHGMDVDGVPIDMSDFGAWHCLAHTMRRAPCEHHITHHVIHHVMHHATHHATHHVTRCRRGLSQVQLAAGQRPRPARLGTALRLWRRLPRRLL